MLHSAWVQWVGRHSQQNRALRITRWQHARSIARLCQVSPHRHCTVWSGHCTLHHAPYAAMPLTAPAPLQTLPPP